MHACIHTYLHTSTYVLHSLNTKSYSKHTRATGYMNASEFNNNNNNNNNNNVPTYLPMMAKSP